MSLLVLICVLVDSMDRTERHRVVHPRSFPLKLQEIARIDLTRVVCHSGDGLLLVVDFFVDMGEEGLVDFDVWAE